MTSTALHHIRHLTVPVAAARTPAVEAGLRRLRGRLVGWFELAVGRGDETPDGATFGEAEADAIVRTVEAAVGAGVPVVGTLGALAADQRGGLEGLHGLGRMARALSDASGQVPVVVVLAGPCTGGAALLLGLADVVVATPEAVGFVSGPVQVRSWTGRELDGRELGGREVHRLRTGVAHVLADDVDHGLELAVEVLSYLPSNNLEVPARQISADPADRPCAGIDGLLPASPAMAYDVRDVLADIVDEGELLELRASWAPNLVTGLARIGGISVGVVANQPCHLAGTIDILASEKGARFVQWCDAFGLPLLTVVDTPGFQPGKDLEWRGMIRKGAQLVHAYAAATVPRVCVIARKAYGGAYIVMDAKTMGSDLCLAWPAGQIAVMGAEGAVEVLHRRELAAEPDADARAKRRHALEDSYRERFLNPWVAARRGLVDAVIEPRDTRRAVALALEALAAKREALPRRRHANIPL